MAVRRAATREARTFSIVTADDAPLGASDHTRRWALCGPDGVRRFPGVTRPEATRSRDALHSLGTEETDDCLVPIQLDVVLSDGAGPYMLDREGTLVLRLGDHPRIPGTGIVMGQADPATLLVGAVTACGSELMRWQARRAVPHAERVAALDALADCAGVGDLVAWCTRTGPSSATRVR